MLVIVFPIQMYIKCLVVLMSRPQTFVMILNKLFSDCFLISHIDMDERITGEQDRPSVIIECPPPPPPQGHSNSQKYKKYILAHI